MKSNILIVVFALLATVPTIAPAQISVGGRIGLHFSNVAAPNLSNATVVPDFRSFCSWDYHIVSEFGVTDHLAIEPELNFTHQGFKIKEGIDLQLFGYQLPLGIEAVTDIKYLNVPILAKYYFGNNKFGGYVMAGPTFGYATSGKLRTQARVIIDFNLYSTPINLNTSDYQRFEAGGMLGAGLAFKVGSGKIFMDARYNHGFTNTYTVPVINATVKNFGFGFGIGYMYTLPANSSRYASSGGRAKKPYYHKMIYG